MAWYTRVNPQRGVLFTLCVVGNEPPSSTAVIRYVNPVTQEEDRVTGIRAWAGNADQTCAADAVRGVIVQE